jgi:hypothetical protein
MTLCRCRFLCGGPLALVDVLGWVAQEARAVREVRQPLK